jgi:hypothetical protein
VFNLIFIVMFHVDFECSIKHEVDVAVNFISHQWMADNNFSIYFLMLQVLIFYIANTI